MGWRYKGGLFLIIAVEILWITSAEIIQGILAAYEHPFAVTYLEISLLAVYLPLSFITDWLKRIAKLWFCNWNDNITESAESILEIKLDPTESEPYYINSINGDADSDHSEHQRSSEKLSTKQVAKLALAIAPLWFLTQYLAKASVARTSVASATILLSTSSLFTLWIGIYLGQESLNTVNIVSVVVSLSGVAITALGQTWKTSNQSPQSTSKNITGEHSYLGDILALLSAMTEALFTVLLKRHAGEGERLNMQMLFGYIGLFTLASLWWLVWPLTALDIEPEFRFPQTSQMKIIVANCFLGSLLCDYFWGLGVAWTTPLLSAIGSSLTIPLAMMEDILFHGQHYSPLYILGSVMVIMGFGISNASKWILSELSL